MDEIADHVDLRIAIHVWMRRWMPFVMLAVLTPTLAGFMQSIQRGDTNWWFAFFTLPVLVLGGGTYKVFRTFYKLILLDLQTEQRLKHAEIRRALEQKYTDRELLTLQRTDLAFGLAALLRERSAVVSDLEDMRDHLGSPERST